MAAIGDSIFLYCYLSDRSQKYVENVEWRVRVKTLCRFCYAEKQGKCEAAIYYLNNYKIRNNIHNCDTLCIYVYFLQINYFKFILILLIVFGQYYFIIN